MTQDPWAEFRNPKEDEWAEFRKPKKSGKREGRRKKPAPKVEFSEPVATDGDTIRDGDVRIRLQGVDAPELGQQGFKRDGATIPIGVNSQSYLDEQLYSPESLALAGSVGSSFGRVVGPVTNDGQDIGLSSLRAGQSFAAPDYITDPQQRFDYMQAQRRARQNRLGVHGVATQQPDEYRANPDHVPEREWVAQFWDTPTPHSGLTAEQEQEWKAKLQTGTADEIAAFARSVGYDIDESRNRKWVEYRDQHVADGGRASDLVQDNPIYTRAARPIVDPGDGQVGATVRQYVKGTLAGGLEESGALIDALGGTDGRESVWNSDRRFADIYANNLYQNYSLTGHDESSYPITSTAAQLAGNVTTGFALPYGAGATTIPRLATVGGAYGAVEGFLGNEGSIPDRLENSVIGGTIGAVADPALGKLVDAAAPYAKRYWQAATRRSGSEAQPSDEADDLAPLMADAALLEQAGRVQRGNLAMAAGDESLSAPVEPVRTRPLLEPSTRAELLASASSMQPKDLLPLPSGDAGAKEAAERVGNIDLSKLDTPQDISRALKQSYGLANGFDAATRGRVSNSETEQLASELGMTPEALLSRRKGQAFNAEEALAARQILAKSGNELVNMARRVSGLEAPGDEVLAEFREKLLRHVAIQEQVAGMTAEAGRTLQQFKVAANSRNVRGSVLGAFVRSGGGDGGLVGAAEALIDAVEMGPGKFNALAAQVTKPKWRDKVSEFYINALLSNPPTHVVNMVSNAITAMAQIPEYAFASSIGAARRLAMGRAAQERILASEVGARTFGLVQGTREGLQLFAKALRTGEADDFVSKVEGDQYRAISGLKGEVVRIPTRFLTAEDQLFKGIARRMELNAQALRIANKEGLKGEARTARVAELVANPTDEMFERALDYGRYLTFQRKLGGFGQSISGATQNSLAAKVVIPFVRTPINLLKFATERSPAAPLLKEWRADFVAGGERRDLAIAKSALGTGLATVFYQMALDGKITGAAPSDPQKARLLYADGWQPYSVKVGDRYISYSRLDPLSTTLGVAADMATLPEGMSEKQREEQSTMLVASIMSNLASKTWLSGVSSFVEGLSDPQRYAGNWMERTASAFAVPAGVAGAARQIDPVARQSDSIGEAVANRLPGLRDDQLPRRDVFGEVITLDSLGPDFISPFWQSQAENDPVIAEMLRINKGVSAPSKQFTVDGERLDYTPEQYDRYHEIAGRLTYNRLLALIGSARYSRMGEAAQRKAAKKAIAEARKQARSVLASPSYPLPPKGDLVGDEWGELRGPSPTTDELSGFQSATPAQEDEWSEFRARSSDENRINN